MRNYSKHSQWLTRSLLQQMVISYTTVVLLPQQTTTVDSLHTRMFSLLYLIQSVLNTPTNQIVQIFFILNLTMEPTTKIRKYKASFKLKVIEVAKASNNSAAAKTFDVTEKMVRDWRKNEDNVRNMPKEK